MINYSNFFSFPEATIIWVFIFVPTARLRIKSPLLHLTKIKTYLKFELMYENVALCNHINNCGNTYFETMFNSFCVYSLFDFQKNLP